MTIGAFAIGSRPIGANSAAYVPLVVVIQDGTHSLTNDTPTIVPHDALIIQDAFHGIGSDVVVPLSQNITGIRRSTVTALADSTLVSASPDNFNVTGLNDSYAVRAAREQWTLTAHADSYEVRGG